MSAPSTPKKKRIVDRYIPQRDAVDVHAAFSLSSLDANAVDTSANGDVAKNTRQSPTSAANNTFSTLLRAELFGSDVPSAVPLTPTGPTHNSPEHNEKSTTSGSRSSTPRHNRMNKNFFEYSPSRRHVARKRSTDLFSSSPVLPESQRLLLSPQKRVREVPATPYRVLDAPTLADDFYLNLLDWGSQNTVAVGLSNLVYVWDAAIGSVKELASLENNDTVTAVSWIKSGTHLAVGTSSGLVQIYDAQTSQRLRTMRGHTDRASSLAWNNHILTSGSRDQTALHRDVRIADHYIKRLPTHNGEVCGLKWNTDLDLLATGCNNDKLFIWSGLNTQPLFQFTEHKAAVKALAWSPHQRGLLASGGGTSDMKICFWNTLTGTQISSFDAESQVSNLAWNMHTRELISTHGYAQNHVSIWKYPSMQQVATLTGHTFRVLYMSMSPDGRTIITGAGDETLRLWNIYNEARPESPSLFNLSRHLR